MEELMAPTAEFLWHRFDISQPYFGNVLRSQFQLIWGSLIFPLFLFFGGGGGGTFAYFHFWCMLEPCYPNKWHAFPMKGVRSTRKHTFKVQSKFAGKFVSIQLHLSTFSFHLSVLSSASTFAWIVRSSSGTNTGSNWIQNSIPLWANCAHFQNCCGSHWMAFCNDLGSMLRLFWLCCGSFSKQIGNIFARFWMISNLHEIWNP